MGNFNTRPFYPVFKKKWRLSITSEAHIYKKRTDNRIFNLRIIGSASVRPDL
jgi:hypothetical protein